MTRDSLHRRGPSTPWSTHRTRDRLDATVIPSQQGATELTRRAPCASHRRMTARARASCSPILRRTKCTPGANPPAGRDPPRGCPAPWIPRSSCGRSGRRRRDDVERRGPDSGSTKLTSKSLAVRSRSGPHRFRATSIIDATLRASVPRSTAHAPSCARRGGRRPRCDRNRDRVVGPTRRRGPRVPRH